VSERVTNHRLFSISVLDTSSGSVEASNFAPTLTEIETDDADPDTATGLHNGLWIVFKTGLLRGKAFRIIDQTNVGGTRAHYVVDPPGFGTIPADEDTFDVVTMLHAEPFLGKAQAGSGANFINLGVRERTNGNWFPGLRIKLIGGTGAGQQREIVAYEPTTVSTVRIAYVNSPWLTVPDATTDYEIQGHLYHPCHQVSIRPKEFSERGEIWRISPFVWGVAPGSAERRIVLEDYTSTGGPATPGKARDIYGQQEVGFVNPLFISMTVQGTGTINNSVCEVERFE